MFRPSDHEIRFIGLFLESLFFGLYTGIFAMYLHYQASRIDRNRTQNIFCFSMCALYVLSVASFVCDIAACACISPLLRNLLLDSLPRITFIGFTSFGCSDFIAQCILIYRCWIVWGCNICIVIVPSILTLTFLATWLFYNISVLLTDQLVTPGWGKPVFLTSLAMSLIVNTLVTGLIVFRIFKVFQQVRATSEDQTLGAGGGSKLQRIILIIIESGTVLFSIQLARFVVTILSTGVAYSRALNIIVGIHQMLNGITPTIILVRTWMGLSFHDEKSMEELAIESFRFASNHPNPAPGKGSIEDSRYDSYDDVIDIRRSIVIDIEER